MNKVICDICGTSYPDTADQCPICGYSRELNGDNVLEDIAVPATEEFIPEPVQEEEEFAAAPVPPVVPDFDLGEEEVEIEAVQEQEFDVDIDPEDDEDEDDDDDDEDEDEDDEDDEPRSNTGLVVILVILIVAILGVMGFIAFRYLLPNMDFGKEAAPTTTAAPIETTATTAPVETTEPTIPCEGLTMVSEGNVILEENGANWLINVVPTPENTTDKILYASSDESVVTVNEAGKLTAVGQGEAVITITCGEQLLQCKVTCFFIEETTEPTETTAPETFPDETTAPTEPEDTTATEPEEETTAPTEPEETQKPSSGNTNTLTLKKTDITFSVVPAFYTLEFEEEGIDMSQVKWTTSDGNVALCHNGQLQVIGYGLCKITAEYKGMKAECIVRVVAR